ncbi:MAG TPA: ferritin-like domain-containing protein, partial [Acidimicrobiales bacterium]|nr:ferritin-like domain-containing protein [Acidimicrobiales bacterium]
MTQTVPTNDRPATELSPNRDIIGRDEIDDFEAILSVVGVEDASGRHEVHNEVDTTFTWDYEKGSRAKLNKL